MGELSKWENTYFSLETFHFLHFFASKLYLLILYFVKKKILKRKLVLPLRWGLKQRCLSVSESEASMGYFHNNLDFKNLFKRLICYG